MFVLQMASMTAICPFGCHYLFFFLLHVLFAVRDLTIMGVPFTSFLSAPYSYCI